jgi:hypothetical protein
MGNSMVEKMMEKSNGTITSCVQARITKQMTRMIIILAMRTGDANFMSLMLF